MPARAHNRESYIFVLELFSRSCKQSKGDNTESPQKKKKTPQAHKEPERQIAYLKVVYRPLNSGEVVHGCSWIDVICGGGVSGHCCDIGTEETELVVHR